MSFWVCMLQLPLPISEAFVPFVRSLKPYDLQDLFSVDVEEDTDVESPYQLFTLTYAIADTSIGVTSICVDNSAQDLWWILFLPHAEFDGLERRGIGTLAGVESLLAIQNERSFSGYLVKNYELNGNMFHMLKSNEVDVNKLFEEYLLEFQLAAKKKGFNYDV